MSDLSFQLGTHAPGDGSLRERRTEAEWREVIEHISARHGLSSSALAPFASGSDVVWGGRDHVVKLTAPRWRDELEAEARWLALVHQRLTCETPELIARGSVDDWPYVVMSRLRGHRSLGSVWQELGHRDRVSLAERVGALIAELHGISVDDLDHDWPAFLAAQQADPVARHRATGVDEAWLEGAAELINSVPLEERDLVLLHTELLDEHILVSERGGRWEPGAVLDFADARVGHPFYEIAAPIEFVFQAERDCLRACVLAMGWDAAELTHERSRQLALWGLLHRFGSLARSTTAAGVSAGDWDGFIRALYGF